jgi:hypothetical protein
VKGGRPGRRGRIALAALVAVALPVTVAAGHLCRAPKGPPQSFETRGVVLGMTEEDAARSFVDSHAGAWSAPSGCDGFALEWNRRDPHAMTRWMRFELRDGRVVAVRAHVDGASPATVAEATPSAVRVVRPDGDGTSITLVSRQAKDYRGEARELIRLAGAR